MNKGIAEGLAYRHDFNTAISNYQREDALDRARQSEQIAQIKMLYDGIPNSPQVMGEHDRKNLAKKYEGIYEDLGKIAKDTPNYASDLEIMGKVYQMKSDLKNDPDILKAISSTDQYNQMMAFAQKNPLLARSKTFVENLEKWKMYNKYGSTDGVNKQGFTFVNPGKQLNVENELTQIGKTMKPDIIKQDQFSSYNAISQSVLNQKAYALVNDQSELGLSLNAHYEELMASGKLPKGLSVYQYTANRLNESFGKPRISSGVKSSSGSGSGNPGEGQDKSYDPYGTLFKEPVNKGNREALQQIIPYNKVNKTITLNRGLVTLPDGWSGDDNKFFKGGNGQYVDSEDQTFYSSIMNQDMTGDVTGETVRLGPSTIGVQVAIDIPYQDNQQQSRDLVEEAAHNGMLENDDFDVFWWGNKDVDGGEGDITPKSKNIFFATRRNKDGKDERILRMLAYVPVEQSDADQLTYNQIVQPRSMNVSPKAISAPDGDVIRTGIDENGNHVKETKYGIVQISEAEYNQLKK